MTDQIQQSLKQPSLLELGGKIREERNKRRLTLEAVSKRTGLSRSLISQVERGKTEPSITTLKKIAATFGFSVVNFFSRNGNGVSTKGWEYPQASPERSVAQPEYIRDIQVVRSDRRKRFALPGSNVVYDLATPDMNRQMELLHMVVKPGETSGHEPMVDLQGEKIGLVLKGVLEVTVNDEVFLLDEGDCIYYPANVPHCWRAVKGESIEVIWVLTPPSF